MTQPSPQRKPISKPTRGLGKGVEALFFSDNTLPSSSGLTSRTGEDKLADDGVLMLSVAAITPGRFQPRKSFDDDAALELTESVRLHGVLQPIMVRYVADEKSYELIAGERRWRAAKAANLATIPALVRTVSDQQMMLFGLIENLQRENLNCLEEAEGIARVVHEHNITHEKTAELLSKSRSSITNALRLLDLSEPVKDYLRSGQLEMGHARALLPLNSKQQKVVADLAVMHQLSVREVEKRAKVFAQPPSKEIVKSNKNQQVDHETQQCLAQLEEAFSLPIEMVVDKLGKGQLIFRFSKKEQQVFLLNRLLTSLSAPLSTPQPE